MTLSDQALSVWAKTGQPGEWLPLAQHMADSRAMATRLYRSWLSRTVLNRWAEELGPQAQVMAEFIAGVHDVGKAAPAFIAQSEPLAQIARNSGLPCPTMDYLVADRRELPHALIGQHALGEWLTIQHGVPKASSLALSSIIGSHHGKPVSTLQAFQPHARIQGMGGPPWQQVRFELLDWMAQATGFDRFLQEQPIPQIPLPILVEMSGFVIVADWLASNTRLFPLQQVGAKPDLFDGDRADLAWDEIGMPPPWEPEPSNLDATEFFRGRFGWPEGLTPHPVQRAAFLAAHKHNVGLMCIETTTGGGKTEAALAAAEVLAARYGAQGLMIALPTQATTNAMFGRITDWIDRLPQRPMDIGAWALMLGHGKARLNPQFTQLLEEFQEFERQTPQSQDMSAMYEDADQLGEPCNAAVHQWFIGAKRRLLANFAVVTIDQLLMAALQRKHLMLAHIALSGKIVIIDEAHASDDYMNVYLDSALSWLGAYGVPVIVLSATLTEARRKEMMRAYDHTRSEEIERLRYDPHDYPLLSILPQDDSPIDIQVIPDNAQKKTVLWRWHSTDIAELVTSVSTSLQGRGCALVVRNTVHDAQATAQALADAGLPVMLNHAGFMAIDRSLKDEELRQLFGRTTQGRRPDLMVVVATQVVEQSLDVDFDVLFTDLAPIDLLLQRIGRLHRHANIRPSHLRDPKVYVLAETPLNEPPQATAGSAFVYGNHLLLRTAAALTEHGAHIRLPDDVSPLIVTALGDDPVGPTDWEPQLAAAKAKHLKLLKKQRDKASQWCVKPWQRHGDSRQQLGTWLKTSSDYSEIQMGATVRDTEPSLEVIIIPLSLDGITALSPPWLQELSEGSETLDPSVQPTEELARQIATWSVRVPAKLTRNRLEEVIETIDQLPITKRWAWRRHPLLKGELLLPCHQQDEGGTVLMTTLKVGEQPFELRYSPEKGLEVFEP